MIKGLDKRNINFNSYANELINGKEMISEYLDGLVSKNETYRYNCFNVLNVVSEKNPGFLYHHWDFFENHLRSNNNYHKIASVTIIANLTAVDKEKRFENFFDEFYSNLKTEKTIVPIYILKYSGRIVNFKPDLEEKITNIFLNIESIHTAKQIELVKSAIIESFSEFFNKVKSKNKIINFVEKQLNSESPKTRKISKEFLEKWRDKK